MTVGFATRLPAPGYEVRHDDHVRHESAKPNGREAPRELVHLERNERRRRDDGQVLAQTRWSQRPTPSTANRTA
jgi:hypothetical protein